MPTCPVRVQAVCAAQRGALWRALGPGRHSPGAAGGWWEHSAVGLAPQTVGTAPSRLIQLARQHTRLRARLQLHQHLGRRRAAAVQCRQRRSSLAVLPPHTPFNRPYLIDGPNLERMTQKSLFLKYHRISDNTRQQSLQEKKKVTGPVASPALSSFVSSRPALLGGGTTVVERLLSPVCPGC